MPGDTDSMLLLVSNITSHLCEVHETESPGRQHPIGLLLSHVKACGWLVSASWALSKAQEWGTTLRNSSDLPESTQALLPQTTAIRRATQIYLQFLLLPQPLLCNSKPLLSWTLSGSSLKGASPFPCGLTNCLCTMYILNKLSPNFHVMVWM